MDAVPSHVSERDAATAAFTQTIAQIDPVRASEWVPQINDPEQRRMAAQLVIGGWSFRDVAAARAWLQGLTGVDERWKAKTLRGTAMNRLRCIRPLFPGAARGLAAGMTVATWRAGEFWQRSRAHISSRGRREHCRYSPFLRARRVADEIEEAILTNLLTTIRDEENSFRAHIEMCRALERLGSRGNPRASRPCDEIAPKFRQGILAGLLERWFEVDIRGRGKMAACQPRQIRRPRRDLGAI